MTRRGRVPAPPRARPGPPRPTIEVIDRRRSSVRYGRALRSFLDRLGAEVPAPPGATIAICLVSDREMRDLNRRYRGKDSTTDVLAFPGDGTRDPDGALRVGDVAISIPRAAAQAREAGHTLVRELEILALHGCLHLLGHDHETDGGEMMRLQRRLVRRLLPSRPRGRG